MHVIERLFLIMCKIMLNKANKTAFRTYKPGKALKILLIGYSGKRNAGAEIRGVEIIKQIMQMNLAKRVHFGILSLNPDATRDYYPDYVEIIPMSSIFFKDLLAACTRYHIGILIEGSCLTSVTSNMAALFFIAASAILKIQGKPCMALGVEAGPMPAWLSKIAKKYCDKTEFIARTQHSLNIFRNYQLNASLGTDTAWSFEPESALWADNELKNICGWQTARPLIGVSIMNPFIRPIKPQLLKYIFSQLTDDWQDHYDKIYFYSNDAHRKKYYQNYLSAIFLSIKLLLEKINGALALIIMEPMDQSSADDLQKLVKMTTTIPVYHFSSSHYNGEQITALLRKLNLLLTSRYHAHVLSLAAGVPCVAIAKDQRLTSIFAEHGLSKYCLATHDEQLINKLPQLVAHAWNERKAIKKIFLQQNSCYLKRQRQMGKNIEIYLNKKLAESCKN